MLLKIKRYLFYVIPSLLLIALVASTSYFFEYERYRTRTNVLMNQLTQGISTASQQLGEDISDLERMFTRFSSNPLIIKTLKDSNTSLINQLFENETLVKPYIRSLSLLLPNKQELIYLSNALVGYQSVSEKSKQRNSFQQLYLNLRKARTNPVSFTQTFSYKYNNITKSVNGYFFGEAIYDSETEAYLGDVLIELDLSYLIEKILVNTPMNMNALVISSNGRYLGSNNEETSSCQVGILSICPGHFDITQIKKDDNGTTHWNNQYIKIQEIYLSNRKNATENNQDSELLLLMQYKDPNLLHRYSFWSLILYSKYIQLSIFLTIILSLIFSFYFIKHEKKIIQQYYSERLSQAFTIISNFIERLHEYDDPVTGSHVHRVTFYSKLLATAYGLTDELAEEIRLFSSLHDIGKIAIPDAVLKKEGALTNDEWSIMSAHTEIGYEIIRQFDISPVAENIARYHHEKWFGKGYQKQLVGEEIPIEARIVSIADCYDALTTERPYKKAFSHEKACAIINAEKGKAFDPAIIDIFNSCSEEIKNYQQMLHESKESGERDPTLVTEFAVK